MDWESDFLQDAIDDIMQEPNDLVAEAYSSIAELNLEIGNPGNAAVDYVKTVHESYEDAKEADRMIRAQVILEQPYNSLGIEKHTSLLRQTANDRDTAFEGSMTSFAIQRFLADMQNAESLSSSSLRKRDDTSNNIFGKI